MSEQDLKAAIRQKYGEAALMVFQGARASCCEPGAAGSACAPVSANLYERQQIAGLPKEALEASLGCGNPTALAELQPGETVLDLGCGGGVDVLLAAQRVGPTGKAYGLDMTEEMLALAEENKRKSGLANVEFLRGDIENIPLPDGSVDVVISNCVINLAADKDRVFGEIYRVLKPGGRLAVSDIVTRGEIPDAVRRSMEAWLGCLAGALEETDYAARLVRAGFIDVRLEATRVWPAGEAAQAASQEDGEVEAAPSADGGRFAAAFIRARKPLP